MAWAIVEFLTSEETVRGVLAAGIPVLVVGYLLNERSKRRDRRLEHTYRDRRDAYLRMLNLLARLDLLYNALYHIKEGLKSKTLKATRLQRVLFAEELLGVNPTAIGGLYSMTHEQLDEHLIGLLDRLRLALTTASSELGPSRTAVEFYAHTTEATQAVDEAIVIVAEMVNHIITEPTDWSKVMAAHSRLPAARRKAEQVLAKDAARDLGGL